MFEILEDKRLPKPTHNQNAESVRHDISANSGADTGRTEDSEDSGLTGSVQDDGPREIIPGFLELQADAEAEAASTAHSESFLSDAILASQGKGNYVAYTIKLPADQLAALQSIWLELKRLYGAHSPDKSGMIQQAIQDWLKRWDGPDRQKLLNELLEIRQDTRRRQYKKG
ncbi:MAG: hypothetical protein Q8T09_15185 [Candidatus Melainabacteria bacterium]|nr:hypothetical protein [Candidatus Melainabacteria bacterium]